MLTLDVNCGPEVERNEMTLSKSCLSDLGKLEGRTWQEERRATQQGRQHVNPPFPSSVFPEAKHKVPALWWSYESGKDGVWAPLSSRVSLVP